MRLKSAPRLCQYLLLLALPIAAGPLAAEELDEIDRPVAALIDLMRQLPPLPEAQTRPASPLGEFTELGPAVSIRMGEAVRIEAQTIFQQGPDDGLEVLLCLQGGKNHEALAWTPTGNAQLVKTAFLLALELDDGQVTQEESGIPARGTPVRVLARWQPDPLLDPDAWVEIDASQLVRNRATGQPYPPLPYVYTGSQIRSVPMTGPDGNLIHAERFMLEFTKSIVVNYDEPDALLASPFPTSARDVLFEVNSRLAPPPRSPMEFIFSAAALPLTLHANVDGELRQNPEDEALSAEALVNLLRAHYHAEANPTFHALALRVPASAPRSLDVALRKRILGLAIQAESWVVPIFVPVSEP